jgi:hypothetical protein
MMAAQRTVVKVLARPKAKVAVVALANKIARTGTTGERYREPLAA